MEIFKNYIVNRRRKGTIKRLYRRYRDMLEIERIMETWITKRILEGQQGRRNELLEKQQAIKEQELFLEYLESI
tara:strand:- start:146 stop:367 length:222 start_codon:yes stop_codon:yes gene_type:complete